MPRAIALSRLVPLTVALAATACMYHVHVLRIDPAPRPPTQQDSVRLLGQEPEQRYTVIAFVSVSPNWALGAGDERLSRHLVKEGAKLGGDAVLLGSESFGSASAQRKLTAKVIVFDRDARATGNR